MLLNKESAVGLAKAEVCSHWRRRAYHPHVLAPFAKVGQRRLVEGRGNQDVRERAVHDRGPDRLIDMPAKCDDAAEGRDTVGLERPLVSGRKRVRHSHATGVGVLDDHCASEAVREAHPVRTDQLVEEVPGRLGVKEVEVGQLAPAVLDGALPPSSRVASRSVLGGVLVGVLPIAKIPGKFEHEVHRGRQVVSRSVLVVLGLVHPSHDGGVVGSSVGERGAGQPAPREVAYASGAPQLCANGRVVLGMPADRPVGGVLGGRPGHGRAADVHRLDRGMGLEGIQVADDEIDRRDVLGGEVIEVGSSRPVGQDAGMDGRMQSLHATIEHLRHASDLGHLAVLDARCLENLGRASARNELDAEGSETLGQRFKTSLVVNRQESSHQKDGTRVPARPTPAVSSPHSPDRPTDQANA